MMQAAAQIRGNATQTAFGMATGLHAELQQVCQVVVAEAAAVAQLPREVWSATSGGRASELAMRAGHENAWAQLVRVGARWGRGAQRCPYLRETGQFQGELNFAYPTAIATQFLNPSAAMDGLDEMRRLPAALRLRAAIDKGWLPGLWLRSDHDRYAAEQRDKPKRSLVGALLGRGATGRSPSVGDEFSA